MKIRLPLPINSNVGMVFPRQTFEGQRDQLKWVQARSSTGSPGAGPGFNHLRRAFYYKHGFLKKKTPRLLSKTDVLCMKFWTIVVAYRDKVLTKICTKGCFLPKKNECLITATREWSVVPATPLCNFSGKIKSSWGSKENESPCWKSHTGASRLIQKSYFLLQFMSILKKALSLTQER